MKRKSLLIICLSVLTHSILVGQKLLINAEKDTKKNIQKTTSSVQSYSVMGQEMENNTTSTLESVASVTNKDQDKVSMSLVTNKLKVTAQIMGQEIEFDSDKNNNSETLSPLKNLTNQTSTTNLNNAGELTDINIPATMKIDPDLESVLRTAGIDMSFQNLYIKSLINQELKVGLLWTDSSTIQGEVVIKTINNYKIDKIENDLIYISNNAVETMVGPIKQAGMTMQMVSSGNVKQSIKVSSKTGFIVEVDSETKAAASVEANGMTIPVSSTTKSKTAIQNQ